MREYTLYIWIGVWLLILPFLGIPGSWKKTLIILTALFLIAHSYVLRRRTHPAKDPETALVTEGKTQNYGIKSTAAFTRQDSDTFAS